MLLNPYQFQAGRDVIQPAGPYRPRSEIMGIRSLANTSPLIGPEPEAVHGVDPSQGRPRVGPWTGSGRSWLDSTESPTLEDQGRDREGRDRDRIRLCAGPGGHLSATGPRPVP